MGFFDKESTTGSEKEELARLERNLKKLADGDYDSDLEAFEGNAYGGSEKNQFVKIDRHLQKIRESFSELGKETESFSTNVKAGKFVVLN